MGRDAQPGFDNQPPEYLSARAASELLGVKRDTLYAYVSRGLVRAVPDPTSRGGRARRYHRDDLLRLRARHDARAGHGPVAAGALRWGEAVLESAVTSISPAGPSYRGHTATTLAARGVTFERVAELLWTASLPATAPWWPPPPSPPLPHGLAALVPPGVHPLRAMTLVPVALAALGPAGPMPPDEDLPRARSLLRSLAASLGLASSRVQLAASQPTLAEAALAALGAARSPAAVAAVNRALVLCADHELNVSTFASRIAASAGADVYACVSAALATASGHLHAGVCDVVEAMAAQAVDSAGAAALIAARVAAGGPVPGFGHPLYPGGDPRGRALVDEARALDPEGTRTAVVLALATVMQAAGREPPTVDLGLVALAAALDLPPGSATALFVLGRSAGWIAHALEQRAQGVLLRPRARYIGRESVSTEPSSAPIKPSAAIPRKNP